MLHCICRLGTSRQIPKPEFTVGIDAKRTLVDKRSRPNLLRMTRSGHAASHDRSASRPPKRQQTPFGDFLIQEREALAKLELLQGFVKRNLSI
jgi:hypothetical protein